jgi:hypothetical protein
MQRHEEDGQVYYAWEEHETKERELFERIMAPDTESVEEIMLGLLNAMAKRREERDKGWTAVKSLIQPEDCDRVFEYNFLSKKLHVTDRKTEAV